MKVKDLIEGWEMCNPEAVIRLGGPEEDEVLSICALAKDNKNIWLESASINPLIKKITTRFKMVENGEITEEENYRNLLELCIGPEEVRKAMGDEVCNKFVKRCVEGGLAKEMGRENLFWEFQ